MTLPKKNYLKSQNSSLELFKPLKWRLNTLIWMWKNRKFMCQVKQGNSFKVRLHAPTWIRNQKKDDDFYLIQNIFFVFIMLLNYSWTFICLMFLAKVIDIIYIFIDLIYSLRLINLSTCFEWVNILKIALSQKKMSI